MTFSAHKGLTARPSHAGVRQYNNPSSIFQNVLDTQRLEAKHAHPHPDQVYVMPPEGGGGVVTIFGEG